MGIATVFTHTLLGDLSPRPWKRALQRLHRRLPLTLVDEVVVSSRSMQAQMEALGLSTPVSIIPNGVDLKRFQPVKDQAEKQRLRRGLGLEPDWDVILAIGPIIPRKGTDALVEAFALLCHAHPRARLVLVGPRHDLARENLQEFQGQLQAVLAGAGAQDRVIFTGPVENVQAYLQAADLLVFPSRREGMPNVVPEAMASGLPVILTPFIGLPAEFGAPGTHYLLSDWEPARLAQDIQRLLTGAALRHGLGQAARGWIERGLSLEKSLDAYAELYHRLARRYKPGVA
jgi:glycosyltransferase involved in cell wall biosynthesis